MVKGVNRYRETEVYSASIHATIIYFLICVTEYFVFVEREIELVTQIYVKSCVSKKKKKKKVLRANTYACYRFI